MSKLLFCLMEKAGLNTWGICMNIGDQDHLHLFQNINDLMDFITVSDRAFRKSTEFYFTYKF